MADPRWTSLPELVRDAAGRFGDREFLRFPEGSLTFAEADAESDRLAGVLAARGVRPGDRVAIMMDNVAGWPLSWLAILKAGAVTVPVNVRYRTADLGFVLRDSGAALVLSAPAYVPLMPPGTRVHTLADFDGERAEAPAVPPWEVANFQYTSGTTGFPKACMLSHDYWLRTAWFVAEQTGLRDDDVVLMAQAFSYMDPQWSAVMCLMAGVPLVVLPRFSASGFWRSAREHGATMTYVLGTMPLLMSKQPPHPLDREHRMRLVLCSGIAPDLHRRFEERWGVAWRELYGSTESGLDLSVEPDAATTVGTGAMGRPPPGKEVRVAGLDGGALPDGEIGEIVVRGLPMMNGYWNHPEATAHSMRGGWFHTGDLGFRDAAGYVHHAGRIKDMIRRGGENISPAEVESVLETHPAVLAAALVPIPDELFGELPKAFVQLNPGHAADTETAAVLVEHARHRLAGYKVPAYLEFVESFPMTPSARIQKRLLLDPPRDQRSGAYDVAAGSWREGRSMIDITVRQDVAIITLNRPAKLNALTGDMRRRLAAALRQYGDGTTVKGIVLTGEGRAFSAGEDLREAVADPPGGLVGEVELFHDITRAALETRIPLVAAYNGIAVGGACEMTLCFDARIGTPATELYFPENTIGLPVSNAASILLPRLAGNRAMRLILESPRIPALDAVALGLLDEIVPAVDLLDAAIALVHRWTGPGTAQHLRLLRPSLESVERAMAAETQAAREAEESGVAHAEITRFLAG
ncbi:AMP-binding protein [Streptosporangium soli]|nr:AMP-binding protein [Streptosporangium sp. KLBMP 9127]